MKKAVVIMLAAVMLLCACAQGGSGDGATSGETMSWQEQYDLGVRYLSEGNYAEAIIAFTAAIEIDPKQAPAFVGRGDAYVGLATLSGTETEAAGDSYNSAVADYLEAISLDPLTVEVYEKLSSVYIELDDYDAAIAILEQGYEATGDERLLELLEELRAETEEEAEEVETVRGWIIYNPDEYASGYDACVDQYYVSGSTTVGMENYGIRFSPAQEVTTENGTVYVEEARITVFDGIENFVGLTTDFTGYLEYTGVEEVAGPFHPEEAVYPFYMYYPNGPWLFVVESYTLAD